VKTIAQINSRKPGDIGRSLCTPSEFWYLVVSDIPKELYLQTIELNSEDKTFSVAEIDREDFIIPLDIPVYVSEYFKLLLDTLVSNIPPLQ
jgi:hypothetical protein